MRMLSVVARAVDRTKFLVRCAAPPAAAHAPPTVVVVDDAVAHVVCDAGLGL